MIDAHCHLLPGIDDGPSDTRESLALARMQLSVGVRHVVATPHVSRRYPNSAAVITECVSSFRAELATEGIALEVSGGAEIEGSYAVELSDAELQGLRLAGSDWLLIEPPESQMMYGFDRLVLQLHSRGHRVVISHPERSPVFARDPDLLARLVGSGALAQSTAGAYAGNFGRSAQRLAHELTRKGLIHIVASDAHGVSGRPPGLREPVAVSGFGQLLDWLCDGVPSSIVRGEPIPDRPRLPASSRRRLLMRRR